MVYEECYLSPEEAEITITLIAVICSYGPFLPLDIVDDEFEHFSGYRIPYAAFGYPDLRTFISTLPEIYIVHDDNGVEGLIQNSQKSKHIKELIEKQKKKPSKSKRRNPTHVEDNSNKQYKRARNNSLSLGSSGFHDNASFNGRYDKYTQLESMMPIFYKHQALGDDFFLDIADTKMGYYVPHNGPKECGLCSAGQTIADLTEKVKNATLLAPRVVVMIGYQDLMMGQSVSDMIYKFRKLIIELKKRNCLITVMTLIETPKMPRNASLRMRMDVFNKTIQDYACDSELQCNVVDMYTIFEREAETFNRDFNRFKRLAKRDQYEVFSDYGRKIFLNTLKTCLREQIEAGL